MSLPWSNDFLLVTSTWLVGASREGQEDQMCTYTPSSKSSGLFQFSVWGLWFYQSYVAIRCLILIKTKIFSFSFAWQWVYHGEEMWKKPVKQWKWVPVLRGVCGSSYRQYTVAICLCFFYAFERELDSSSCQLLMFSEGRASGVRQAAPMPQVILSASTPDPWDAREFLE